MLNTHDGPIDMTVCCVKDGFALKVGLSDDFEANLGFWPKNQFD